MRKWEFWLCMAALSTAACSVSVSTGESKRPIDELEAAVQHWLADGAHSGAHVDCGAALQIIPAGGTALCDVQDGAYRDRARLSFDGDGTITDIRLLGTTAEAG